MLHEPAAKFSLSFPALLWRQIGAMARTLRVSKAEMIRLVLDRHLNGVFVDEYEALTGCDQERSQSELKVVCASAVHA